MDINQPATPHPTAADPATPAPLDLDQIDPGHSTGDQVDAEPGIPSGQSGREDSAVPATENLLSLLMSMDDVSNFLTDLTTAAALAVGPSASCAITARHDHQPWTVASSDARAAALDESQYVALDGPCLQALRTGRVVSIPDLAFEDRWPVYRIQARASGLASSLSLPLRSRDGTTLGALNVYHFELTHAFDDDLGHRAETFAAEAAGALYLATRYWDAAVSEQLEQALSSRSVIDQALGILMGQQHCTADEAFTLLRKRSQSSQHKLRDVAADLIDRATGQPPTTARPFER